MAIVAKKYPVEQRERPVKKWCPITLMSIGRCRQLVRLPCGGPRADHCDGLRGQCWRGPRRGAIDLQQPPRYWSCA
jgi:hypothetical protein